MNKNMANLFLAAPKPILKGKGAPSGEQKYCKPFLAAPKPILKGKGVPSGKQKYGKPFFWKKGKTGVCTPPFLPIKLQTEMFHLKRPQVKKRIPKRPFMGGFHSVSIFEIILRFQKIGGEPDHIFESPPLFARS